MKYPLKNILRNFLNHVEDLEIRRSRNDDQYEVEFQQLKQLTDDLKNNPDYSCTHGLKDVNRPKNRYKDIVPYDFCRVVIPEFSGLPGSDYINASHVKGASGAFAYIAAQGPLPNTVIDFWRLIWVCDVQVIVMACNERESGKTKCECYWAEPGEKKQFGMLSVQLVSQAQVCPDFLVRTLLVHYGEETREISQFHYTSWPDHGVPERVHPILELVRLVRDCQASETAPILVHCSAGCGRTGTICAIDYVWACLRTGKLKEDFCLYDIVAEMRRQRIAMVQTKEQYMLVHRAVATMFEQQIRLIDNHTYENLDRDGIPIKWTPKYKESSKVSDAATMPETSRNNQAATQSLESCNTLLLIDESEFSQKLSQQHSSDDGVGHAKSQRNEENNLHLKEDNTSDSCFEETKNSGKSEALPNFDDKPVHSSLGRLLLTSPGSAESIPFIDDDDTKSEIQVRARCGRAYLHIPSCDSISKIVNHFDPFVDQVWSEIEVDSPGAQSSGNSSLVMAMDQVSHGEASNVTSCFGSQRTSKSSLQWVKGQILEEPLIVELDTGSKSPSSFNKELSDKVDDGAHEKCSEGGGDQDPQAVQKETQSCGSSICPVDEDPNDKSSSKEPTRSFSRRPSIVKLKGLFDKSKTKNNSKSSLFRHHTHHVSRAGSAPPSLNSMKRNSDNEKESLFAMVSRKFRSSSVKSEQELQKESSSSSTSHLSTLKRTAANSLSTFKHNLSNFSRNIQFGKASKQAASIKEESVKSPEPSSSKGHNKSSSKSEIWRKPSTSTGRVEVENIDRFSSIQDDDSRDKLQQKFVVNVLSSSPAVRNKGTIHHFSEKPSSPKDKSFMSDFECLKTNPVRLLSKSIGSKNNSDGPSSLWYSDVECKELDNNENQSASSISTVSSNSKALKLSDSSVAESPKEQETDDGVFSKIKVKLPSPFSHSVFYTNIHDKQASTSQQPLVGTETDAERTGNSRFFWPLSSVQETTTKTPLQNEANPQKSVPSKDLSLFHQEPIKSDPGTLQGAVKTQDIETPPTNLVLKSSDIKSDPGTLQSAVKTQDIEIPPTNLVLKSSDIKSDPGTLQGAVKTQDIKIPPVNLVLKSSDTKVSLSSTDSSLKDRDVSANVKNKGDGNDNVLKSSDTLNSLIAKSPSSECSSTKVSENMSQSVTIPEPNKELDLFPEPPALPKKTVVGKKRFDHFLNSFIEPVKVSSNNLEKSEPCGDKPVENTALIVEANSSEVPEAKCAKSSSGKSQELYINVNDVAKKNIEQIESTLRNHPRGAIIDLTSRQSYSMEQELNDAIQKLPEPTKKKESSVAKLYPGYEVIWPEKIAETKRPSETDQIAERKMHPSKEVNLCKPSGICYSPPLRRSVHASFPVLKSRSCASLDWLHSDQNDANYQKKDKELKSDSTDTLVNEAVVELSTLLDELTTKTLSDDLSCLLDSPKSSKKDETSSGVSVTQDSSLESSELESFNSVSAIPKPLPPIRSVSPHKYETIYIPQKQALSIKHGNEEEIIFHFPPPPPIPPPPVDNVTETFDIICKDGVIQLPESTQNSIATCTTTVENSVSSSCNHCRLDQGSVPTPVPRKSKHRASGLRKSASYTTLITQSSLPIEITSDHSQTLPRLQIANEIDSSQKLSDSLVVSVDKSVCFQPDFPRYNRKFSSDIDSKQLLKQLELNENSKLGSSCKKKISVDVGDHPSSYSNIKRKADMPGTTFISTRQQFPEKSDSMKYDRKYIKSKAFEGGIQKSPSDIIHLPKFSRHMSMDQNVLYLKEMSVSKPSDSFTKHSPIYGKVVKNRNNNDPKLTEQALESVQVKKSVLPSRKDKPAPHPSSPKQAGDLINLNEGKSVKKPASRKSERAPAPPGLQKSSSLKFSSSNNFEGNDIRVSPTYAMVQKHKLPLVFENIPDSHSSVKHNNFRTGDLVEGHSVSTKQQHSCSLQHSHSDASVFLALREEKFLKKSNGSVKPCAVNNTKTSSEGSSSSDSDNSYRNINLTSEQMFHKTFLKQRTALPVVPPRSKRRNTTEIHYMKDLKGAASSTAHPTVCDMYTEAMPRVPVKTKEAFEVPDEFKVSHLMNEKPKSSYARLSSERSKMAMEERVEYQRKTYRKQ